MPLYRAPKSFLEVRVRDLSHPCGLIGLCAGYEASQWRANQLASHVMEWLPEFALRHSEVAALGADNAVHLMNKAAKAIYTSKKYQGRGEFGEVLLHIAIRQCFDTLPAISKYYFKDASNDTVKGFDAVHVVVAPGGLELWLGEAKFYDDINRAIREATDELIAHTARNYLTSEFVAITNKIDDTWPYADQLKKMIDGNVSLDNIVSAVCLPVLLTYDSPAISAHKKLTTAFKSAFEKEIRAHHSSFVGKKLPKKFKIHLFLIPLMSKKDFVDKLDAKLKAWQTIF